MPRILFCCPTTITPKLGASKVYIEMAEGFRRHGWDVTLVGPEEVAGGPRNDLFGQPPHLCRYLREHAGDYDVVEYESHALPYPRAGFAGRPLFVARSVILAHSIFAARIPPMPTLRGRVGRFLKYRRERRRQGRILAQAELTLQQADLISLANEVDFKRLLEYGHPAAKIVCLPYGLFPERLAAFHPQPDALTPPEAPRLAFVGTFDPRKGMAEFPRLVAEVLAERPKGSFRLIGVKGQLRTAADVLWFFPRRLRQRIEVIPEFEPADLPRLLADCSLGVFPSHVESFGFGVLEMLAAGLPVVAYDAPGPGEMLPADLLTPVGNAAAMARRALDLLGDPERLRAARRWARARAEEFTWDRVITRTANAYLTRLATRADFEVSEFNR
jgi:glycosyltransferase involved in cell wall biosynthesis